MMKNKISRAAMGRLPAYLSYVRELPSGQTNISATAIADKLKLGEVQVRKDLSAVCGCGKPKIGYNVAVLRDSLELALGVNTGCEAVIVGAGKLGSALLGFGGFSEYGITISCAFDNCDKCFGEKLEGAKVLPMSEFDSYCSQRRVDIGIIAVPPEYAQSVAELMVENGIHAIWCFAAAKLSVPDDVIVQYENLALSLAHLHQRLKSEQIV